MTHNLYALFRDRFPSNRQRPMLTDERGRTISFGEAEAAVARMVGALTAAGLKPGDRVSAQVDKSPDLLIFYLACLAGGFVFHPINTAYREMELSYLLADAEPSLAIFGPESAESVGTLARAAGVPKILTLGQGGGGTLLEAAAAARPVEQICLRRADDLAALIYSSGTTGKPKGAMLTHGNLASNAAALVQAWEFSSSDRLLHALPLFHVHGLFVGVSCALFSGASMRFLPRFEAASVLRFLPETTVFMGVPTYYTRLLAEPGFGSSLCRSVRLFISGSAPLLPDTFRGFQQASGHLLVDRYGMTETLLNSSNPVRGERVAGSVGLPLPGVSMRIADPEDRPLGSGVIGEIQVKGPNVCRGYWRNPDKTAEAFTADGWFRTGDLARRDDRGYYFIVGRAKDLIIAGGLNVYPKEVEECIDKLEGVAESAVVGIPHPDFGEVVVAAVVPDGPETGQLNEEMVIRHVKDHLANFKAPKRVRFLPELPRNAMGKVEKTILRRFLDDQP
ncbi:MAG TPA: AMP-binding protein [Alphaproteobacteria bacterium]|nr:AMP-binding protein [Alphaproteobacteria bacterium]